MVEGRGFTRSNPPCNLGDIQYSRTSGECGISNGYLSAVILSDKFSSMSTHMSLSSVFSDGGYDCNSPSGGGGISF